MKNFRGASTHLVATLVVLTTSACAKIGAPPGGPEDKVPPQLIATRPDSMAVISGFKGSVELQFNETVSEGGTPSLGTGTSDLERLIILSPSNNVPEVGWHRSRLSIKPKEGWKANRVYRVQLLPGVQDIRNNKADTSVVITFTTGAPLPTTTLSGRVVDWETRRMAAGTLVEAILQPDSLPYRALTDTSGKFEIGPIPAGSYLVFAVADQNRNHRRESRELFDSLRVDSLTFTIPPLWLQPHDSLAPRIQTITPGDSSSAQVQFSGPLDPYAPPPFAGLRLMSLPDSTPIQGAQLLTRLADSTLRAQAKALADSLARLADTSSTKPDTTGKKVAPGTPLPPVKPKPVYQRPSSLRPINERKLRPAPDTVGVGALLDSRPPLEDKLTLHIPGRFEPGGKYLLLISAVRGVSGKSVDTHAAFSIPVPKPVKTDSTKAKTDSAHAQGDSTRLHPDSAVARPAPARPDSIKPTGKPR
ncbi:MAG: Ig-like domain-containing protein [Gemmatimonadota bacterium]